MKLNGHPAMALAATKPLKAANVRFGRQATAEEFQNEIEPVSTFLHGASNALPEHSFVIDASQQGQDTLALLWQEMETDIKTVQPPLLDKDLLILLKKPSAETFKALFDQVKQFALTYSRGPLARPPRPVMQPAEKMLDNGDALIRLRYFNLSHIPGARDPRGRASATAAAMGG